MTVEWVEDGLLVSVRKGSTEILLFPGEANELTAQLITCLNEHPEALKANWEAPDGNGEYYE